MAYRTEYETVRLLGSTRERQNELALPPLFSPRGSVNMRMLDIGALQMVNGYTVLDDDDTTTDTGLTSAAQTGIYAYRAQTSGSTVRRLVRVIDDGVDEVEIWHSTDNGVSWTFLVDVGSGPVGLIPTFAQYEDNLYITFGGFGSTVAIYEYDGTTAAVAGQTQPNTPTIAVNGAGLLNGTYKYKVAVIDSNGDVGPASDASAEATADNLQIRVTFTAAGGSNNGVRIFRTLGDGDVFFRVADEDSNASTTYDDNISDFELIRRSAEVKNTGEAPPAGATFVDEHRARLFYARTSANPNRLWWGDLGRGDSVGASNFLRIGEGEDGDYITGIKGEFGGALAIFKEYSIWLLEGDDRESFNLIRSEATVGAVAHTAILHIQAGALYNDPSGNTIRTQTPTLAYLAPDMSVRIFNGINDELVSNDVADTLSGMTYADRGYSLAFWYAPYNWAVWGFSSNANAVADTWVAWDTVYGSWHVVDFLPGLRSVAVGEQAGAQSVVYGGEGTAATGAKTYQLFSGTAADGANITATVRTKGLDFGEPHRTKVLRTVDPIYKALSSSLSVSVKVYRGWINGSATAFGTFTQDMEGADVDSVNPGPIDLMSGGDAYPIDEAFTYEFTLTGQTVWELRGFESGYQLLPPSVVRRP